GAPFNYPDWSPQMGNVENLPINCTNWYEAYAFCIWDGGFLPSAAEWNFAASGGNEQRAYPWSTSSSSGAACANTNAFGDICLSTPAPVGTESPAGDGKWGQTDLAGNMAEWVLDNFVNYNAIYPKTCADCASLPAFMVSTEHLFMGGGIYIPGTPNG